MEPPTLFFRLPSSLLFFLGIIFLHACWFCISLGAGEYIHQIARRSRHRVLFYFFFPLFFFWCLPIPGVRDTVAGEGGGGPKGRPKSCGKSRW